jgi:hypothetical protein
MIMGTYVRLGRFGKLKHTRRGLRLGIGPSWCREWFGAGGRSVSTGADIGPVWAGKYIPLRRRRGGRR